MHRDLAAKIIGEISHRELASPIVTVPKKDGSYHICGDYKVTMNLALESSSVYEALFALSFSFLSERFSLCLIHSQKK